MDESSYQLNKIYRFPNLITVLFFIIVAVISGFIFLLFVIDFPETVVCNVVLMSENQRSSITSKMSGTLHLLRENNSYVTHGEMVGFIENNVNIQELLQLDTLVQNILQNQNTFSPLLFPDFKQLGKLQNGYYELINDYHIFENQSKNTLYKKYYELFRNNNEISSSKRQNIDFMIENLKMTIQILAEKKEKFGILLEKGLIAEEEYKKIELDYINAVNTLESQYKNNADQHLEVNNLKVSLEREHLEHSLKNDLNYEQYIKSANNLSREIAEWKNFYLLLSNNNGVLLYSGYWKNNQYIYENKELATIVPTRIVPECYAFVKAIDISRVKEKQKVKINFAGYPTVEYGQLVATISKVAEIRQDSTYRIALDFNKNLLTDKNKKIDFRHELLGKGEIIVEDKKLIVRILENYIK